MSEQTRQPEVNKVACGTSFIMTIAELEHCKHIPFTAQELADWERVEKEIQEEMRKPRPNGGILMPLYDN